MRILMGYVIFLADDGSYSGAVEQIIQELAEEEKRRELWEKLQLSEIRETLTEEHKVEQSNGSRCWWQETVLMSQEMVYESKTKQTSTVIGAIILFKDISEFHEQEDRERERLQVAYEKADLESRAKTEFMNRMSHDIRTPINGILGMIQMIRKNYKDQEKIEECVDKMDLSVQHLSELVNDVLDMSKIESGYLELQNDTFDLNTLIDQVEVVVSAQVEAMEISYESHREKVNHTMLSGDTLQIRRIMLNLFSNAIKYNKRGERIDTYVKELSFDGMCAAFEFRITDTGVGMSREYDAVLMDIMMPELDGKEASRKIRSMADQREDAAEIPILAMTAQASTESIHQCKSAGMNECIFKPVNAKELIRLLQDIVAKI